MLWSLYYFCSKNSQAKERIKRTETISLSLRNDGTQTWSMGGRDATKMALRQPEAISSRSDFNEPTLCHLKSL